jgi:hypothetical protein
MARGEFLARPVSDQNSSWPTTAPDAAFALFSSCAILEFMRTAALSLLILPGVQTAA